MRLIRNFVLLVAVLSTFTTVVSAQAPQNQGQGRLDPTGWKRYLQFGDPRSWEGADVLTELAEEVQWISVGGTEEEGSWYMNSTKKGFAVLIQLTGGAEIAHLSDGRTILRHCAQGYNVIFRTQGEAAPPPAVKPVTPPSPQPTLPPPPTVKLTADSSSVEYNGSTRVRWTSQYATSCVADGSWNGTKETWGSEGTGALTLTPTYSITCTNEAGSAQSQVSVLVGDAPQPPTTCQDPKATNVDGDLPCKYLRLVEVTNNVHWWNWPARHPVKTGAIVAGVVCFGTDWLGDIPYVKQVCKEAEKAAEQVYRDPVH